MEELGGLLISIIALIIAIAMMLAQFRLFSIDKTLKQILEVMQKEAQPSGPAAPDTEADLTQRRAAIADAQKNWPTYK
jgi:hypothetical protein